MRTHLWIVAAVLGCVLAPSSPVAAQSLQERIAQVKRERQVEEARKAAEERQSRVRRGILVNLNAAEFQDMTARDAFAWLGEAAELPIVVAWQKLEELGVDPELKVQLVGQKMTVASMLDLLVRQLSNDLVEVMWEPTPHYVEILTKEQANQRSVIMIYPIGDILFEVPNFTNAPKFDLNNLGQSSGGFGGGGFGTGGVGGGGGFGVGGGGGGGGGLFGDSGREDEDERLTREERAEQIAELIRETIEPELWRENGGQYGSIRFLRDSLIIRAPMYVHRQIGGGSGPIGGDSSTPISSGASSGATRRAPVGRYVTFDASFGQSQPTGVRQVPFTATPGAAFGPQVGTLTTGSTLQLRGRVVGVERPRAYDR